MCLAMGWILVVSAWVPDQNRPSWTSKLISAEIEEKIVCGVCNRKAHKTWI
jgi:hypothetical protein